jgi:uncharacterized YccA/Bax inhibitor family protein
MIQILICTLGAVLGWIVGIIITPFNEAERKQFSVLVKTFAALLSGFVLGKIELILNAEPVKKIIDDDRAPFSLLIFSICFFVGVLFTFIGRKYVVEGEEERRIKREKILIEVRDTLKKLDELN